MIWTRTTHDVVAPTLADPMLRSASEVLGGPLGKRARTGSSWASPALVVVLIATFVMSLAWVHDSRCLRDDGTLRPDPYALTHLCYSDLPLAYTTQGFGDGVLPYEPIGWLPGDVQPQTPAEREALLLDYPVLAGAWFGLGQVVTQAVSGAQDLDAAPQARDNPDYPVQVEAGTFWGVLTVFGFAALLIGLVLLVRAQPKRPWDAALVAGSPLLVLSGQINVDLPAFALVAAGLWAWSTRRPVASGVLLGLAVAMRLYPVLLLLALLLVCVRAHRVRAWAVTAIAAVVTWLVVDVPVYLVSTEQFWAFWRTNVDQGAELGSPWSVLDTVRAAQGSDTPTLSAATLTTVTAALFVAAVIGIAALTLLARRRPRVAQVAFLLVAAMLVINKVYSPQFALWLLPLACLARPRLRDLLVWQAAEAFYFLVVWMHVAGLVVDAGQLDWAYVLGVGVRLFGVGYLVVLVVRDVLKPWYDPVRRDGLSDDPLGGVVDEVRESDLTLDVVRS